MLSELKEEYNRAKDRTFIEYSKRGAESVLSDGREYRNPPDLSFGTLGNTNTIFKKLCDPVMYSWSEFLWDFEQIGAVGGDCPNPAPDGDDRLESHLKFLVLGAAFAAANVWSVALSQGERAISIAERLPSKEIPMLRGQNGERKSFLSGREAYFLSAVAKRMIAKRGRDFESALRDLAKSERALKLDQAMGTALKLTTVRYENERLEIALSRYYHARKNRHEEWKSKTAGADEIRPDYEKLLPHYVAHLLCEDFIEPIFLAARGVLNTISHHDPKHRDFRDLDVNLEWMGRVSLVHTATNFIQVATIQAFRRYTERVDYERPISLSDLEQALKIIAHFKTPPPQKHSQALRQTPLVELYSDMGARLLGDEGVFPWAKADVEIDALFSNTHARDVTHYDSWRFDQLKDFALRMNGVASEVRRALLV